jgi:NAD-dependent deacetylase
MRSTPTDVARSRLAEARAVVAFTGAGVAAESGIPTFRGSTGDGGPPGLWDKYSPAVYGTPWGLAAAAVFRPGRFRRFVGDVATAFFDAEPNAGHRALGELTAQGRLRAVITQNIDDLHERGGADPVFKLHGDLLSGRCLRCRGRNAIQRGVLRARLEAATERRHWRATRHILSAYPRCPECGGGQRPDVVLFGEGLPRDQWRAAESALEECDLLLISGTSGSVYPANRLPHIARHRGVTTIEISPEPTAYSAWVDWPLSGTFGETMPQLLAE